jgi:hypothetical protein
VPTLSKRHNFLKGDYKPDFRVGERLRLLVREPLGRKDARITHPGNYVPVAYVGEVEETAFQARVPQMRVRWHLPASYGYDTAKGTVSTLIHVANGVWLETRRSPRNVVATIERIPEEEYQQLLAQAQSS